jgi:hypothetical protein
MSCGKPSSVVMLLLLLGASAMAGKKPPRANLVKLPAASAAIESLMVPKAEQKCPNWAWATAIEVMLTRQDVSNMPQSYWVTKAGGGEVCIESPVALDDLKELVEGDYVLPSGNNVHFEGVVNKGAPKDVGYLIKSVREGRPLLVIWNDRPLVLQGITFDEYIYPNNQRMFEARQLTLVDPIALETVIFDKEKNDPAEITGTFEVRVGPVEHFR